ncbi:MAG: hypothetical protein ABSC42_15920, partial [Tepidisphaeraceae bacterium]
MRLADFPSRYVKRDFDERPYAQCGLALWEGITPTYSYAPAGPHAWISWAYAAASTSRYLILPSPEERAAPWVLRPFTAGNHALFDIYRDWSILRLIEVFCGGIVAVAACAAGFRLGWKWGGWAPAFLVGGMAAVLPLFVELSGESRPYAMAWGFGIIAIYYAVAASDRPKAQRWSAIFMGLAIASRIDMLLILPLICIQLWNLDASIRPRLRRLMGYSLFVAVVSLLVSPWLLTNLIGNLRAIATVRFAQPVTPVSKAATLLEIVAHQGLAVDLLLVVCPIFLTGPGNKGIRRAAAIYVILLSVSMLHETGYGLRHHGAPLVALITFAGVGMAGVARRWPRVASTLLVLALAPPAIATTLDIVQRRSLEVVNHSTQWVERHVPPGTRVYLSPGIHDPLPTVAASNLLWAEVTDLDAWKKKLESGMTRFGVRSDDYPRAFSEANMIVERALRREWFILGSRSFMPDPRFDVRVFSESMVFARTDISAAFKRTGGVLVCDDGEGAMPTDVGTPVVRWVNSRGQG